jgi:hypothetical protein
MTNDEKLEFLAIRMRGKTGRDISEQELEFLAQCRKDHPRDCAELEKEVRHRAMEHMNPFYSRANESEERDE